MECIGLTLFCVSWCWVQVWCWRCWTNFWMINNEGTPPCCSSFTLLSNRHGGSYYNTRSLSITADSCGEVASGPSRLEDFGEPRDPCDQEAVRVLSRGWGFVAAHWSGCATAPPSDLCSSGSPSSDGGRRPESDSSDRRHLNKQEVSGSVHFMWSPLVETKYIYTSTVPHFWGTFHCLILILLLFDLLIVFCGNSWW